MHGVEIGVIKFWGARVMYNVIDRAIQIHGSLGYTTDLPLESMYRAAGPHGSTTGPTRCTRSPVARQILKSYRPSRSARRAHPHPTRPRRLEKYAAYLDDLAVSS